MEGMEDKLNSIIGNPELMAQIATMAKSLNNANEVNASTENENKYQDSTPNTLPNLDPGMLQKVASVIHGSGIDSNQQALLKALRPYLSVQRIAKLEKAMRAAKLAGFASAFLGKTGASLFTGR